MGTKRGARAAELERTVRGLRSRVQVLELELANALKRLEAQEQPKKARLSNSEVFALLAELNGLDK